MDSYDEMAQRLRESFDVVYESCIDNLVTTAENWQGDTPNDFLARGMIGTMRPLMDSLRETMGEENTPPASQAVFNLATSLFMSIAQHLAALDDLGRLRDSKS